MCDKPVKCHKPEPEHQESNAWLGRWAKKGKIYLLDKQA